MSVPGTVALESPVAAKEPVVVAHIHTAAATASLAAVAEEVPAAADTPAAAAIALLAVAVEEPPAVAHTPAAAATASPAVAAEEPAAVAAEVEAWELSTSLATEVPAGSEHHHRQVPVVEQEDPHRELLAPPAVL